MTERFKWRLKPVAVCEEKMEEIKNAVSRLEEAVMELENAVYTVKKNYGQSSERAEILKKAVKTAYDKIDDMLTTFKRGEE